jgi:hypothetical protein
MQLIARLFTVLPVVTGNGKNGTWKKQEFVVETDGQYPKKVCISVWGDKIDTSILVPGNMLKIDFDLESREYNGRWFTEARAWRLETADSNAASQDMPSKPASSAAPQTPPTMSMSSDVDDLPF